MSEHRFVDVPGEPAVKRAERPAQADKTGDGRHVGPREGDDGQGVVQGGLAWGRGVGGSAGVGSGVGVGRMVWDT